MIIKRMNWDDKASVLKSVREDGTLLQYASDSLKNDRYVVLEAVIQYENSIDWSCPHGDNWPFFMASENIQNDISLLFQMVKRNGFLYRFAINSCLYNKNLCDNKKLAQMAVKRNTCALQFIHNHLIENRNIIIKALKKNIYAREWVLEKLKKDREVSILIPGELK